MAFYFNHGNMTDRMDHHEPASIPTTPVPSINQGEYLPHQPQALAKRGRRDFKISKLFDAKSASPQPPVPSAPRVDKPKNQSTNPFAEGYNPNDLIFNAAGQVTYATWRALIIYLTIPSTDIEFVRVFFIGFRLFATPRELAEALVLRAHIPPPVTKSASELRTWRERKLRPIQSSIIHAIKHWLENAWCPQHDPPCLPVLTRFLTAEYKNMKHGILQRECLKILRRIYELHRSGSPEIESMQSLLAPAP
ncbi:Ras guanine nucleotide exchange factor bud5, partial [Linderina macrospora]